MLSPDKNLNITACYQHQQHKIIQHCCLSLGAGIADQLEPWTLIAAGPGSNPSGAKKFSDGTSL